jgi:mannose-1-phosphate guanylyltransferase
MLQHTIDRAVRLVPPRHTVTVIGHGHRSFLADQEIPREAGRVIEQPAAFGTLPGVLLPAICIWACDPKAILLILPSDHFIHPEERFLEYAREAFLLAERYSDRIILMGTKSNRPETEYGWIQPDTPFSPSEVGRFNVSQVSQFLEKPSLEKAHEFHQNGYFWNTMIFSVKAETLKNLAYRYFPRVTGQIEMVRNLYFGQCDCRLHRRDECLALARIYKGMRSIDFSGELLERSADRTVLLEMDDIEWCDWGRPERIVEGLNRIGKRPLFPSKWITDLTQEEYSDPPQKESVLT